MRDAMTGWWRGPGRADGPVAIALTAVGVASAVGHPAPIMLAAVLFGGAVAVRRTSPLAGAMLLAGAAAVIFATHPHAEPPRNAFFCAPLVLYAAGAYGRRWVAWMGLAVGVSIDVAAFLLSDYRPATELIWVALVAGGPWALGRLLRAQRRLSLQLEDRALALEHEREARRQLAVSAERGRIARELHDAIGHSLSVMIVQAGAGERVVRREPLAAAGALAAIADTGRQALREIDRLLGFLDEAPAGEVGGLERLDVLVQRARAAGLPVTVDVSGAARPLPPDVELCAYRITQEALTNTLKHAGAGVPTTITVAYGDDALHVEIRDAGAATVGPQRGWQAGGHGLAGMRERVALFDGDLRAAPVAAGGFAVRARLPLPGSPTT